MVYKNVRGNLCSLGSILETPWHGQIPASSLICLKASITGTGK